MTVSPGLSDIPDSVVRLKSGRIWKSKFLQNGFGEKEKKEVVICYIHKIAMKEIKHEEPIPELGIYNYKEYKCPMCLTSVMED